MDNNTVLRSLRYALNASDQDMADIFLKGGVSLDAATVELCLKGEEDEGFQPLENKELIAFLDGLILQKRGPSDRAPVEEELNNNLVLRKLRIAFELRDDDMIRTISKGGFVIKKPELSALFRKKGHKHYRACGDQLLRYFLKGLGTR